MYFIFCSSLVKKKTKPSNAAAADPNLLGRVDTILLRDVQLTHRCRLQPNIGSDTNSSKCKDSQCGFCCGSQRSHPSSIPMTPLLNSNDNTALSASAAPLSVPFV
jgi:hypothetical protein